MNQQGKSQRHKQGPFASKFERCPCHFRQPSSSLQHSRSVRFEQHSHASDSQQFSVHSTCPHSDCESGPEDRRPACSGGLSQHGWSSPSHSRWCSRFPISSPTQLSGGDTSSDHPRVTSLFVKGLRSTTLLKADRSEGFFVSTRAQSQVAAIQRALHQWWHAAIFLIPEFQFLRITHPFAFRNLNATLQGF